MVLAARNSSGNAQIVYRAPTGAERQIYSAHRISAVVDTLAGDGIPSALTLAGSGIEAAQLADPSTRVSYRQIETVFRNAMRLSRDPTVALRAGRRMHITSYGMYGYAILSSPTTAESIAFGVKCHRITGSVVDMAFSSDKEAGAYTYEPVLWPDPTQDLYRFALEFTLTSHLTVIQDVFGKALRPLRVSLAYPAPSHARAYREMLRCQVLFKQRSNQMAFDAAWIARPVPLGDPITHASCRDLCEQILSELNADASIASDIRSLLILHPGGFPSVEAIAEQLALHPRALRRRLNAENTSYRRLLAEVRSRLAIEYLRRTSMTNDEIATRLGYSDAANFRRAFTAWTGKHPSDFRVG